jgi:hypothetical protein
LKLSDLFDLAPAFPSCADHLTGEFVLVVYQQFHRALDWKIEGEQVAFGKLQQVADRQGGAFEARFQG